MATPPKRRRRRRVLLLRVLLILLVALTAATLLQRWLIYPRYLVSPDDTLLRGVVGLERLEIGFDGGVVDCYILRGDGTSAATPGPAVIFAHGNGEVIQHWPVLLTPYRRRGITVMIPEYRGYGRSDGWPSQGRIGADFRTARDLLVARREVDPERLVYHGRSLGGGVACQLAKTHPPAALILQSTFTSVRAMAARRFFPGFLVLDPYDNLAVVRALDRPLLLLHGDEDRTVPYDMSRSLRDAALNARLETFSGGHNERVLDREWAWEKIFAFLEENDVLLR